MDENWLTPEKFARFLEVYGSDLDRWPASFRAPALALIGKNGPAAVAHAETTALDRVLAMASKADSARLQPLADRIVAVAIAGTAAGSAEPRAATPQGARIIPLQPRKRQPAAAPPTQTVVQPAGPHAVREPGKWRAATALAASLMLGVMIGIADLTPTSVFGLGSSEDASASDAEFVLSALQGNSLQTLDEDEL